MILMIPFGGHKAHPTALRLGSNLEARSLGDLGARPGEDWMHAFLVILGAAYGLTRATCYLLWVSLLGLGRRCLKVLGTEFVLACTKRRVLIHLRSM